MDHAQLEVAGLPGDSLQADARGRRVDQLAAGHQRGWLGEPGWKPERLDLPLRLIAGTGTAIEAIEGGRVQEKGLHHDALVLSIGRSLAADVDG